MSVSQQLRREEKYIYIYPLTQNFCQMSVSKEITRDVNKIFRIFTNSTYKKKWHTVQPQAISKNKS